MASSRQVRNFVASTVRYLQLMNLSTPSDYLYLVEILHRHLLNFQMLLRTLYSQTSWKHCSLSLVKNVKFCLPHPLYQYIVAKYLGECLAKFICFQSHIHKLLYNLCINEQYYFTYIQCSATAFIRICRHMCISTRWPLQPLLGHSIQAKSADVLCCTATATAKYFHYSLLQVYLTYSGPFFHGLHETMLHTAATLLKELATTSWYCMLFTYISVQGG